MSAAQKARRRALVLLPLVVCLAACAPSLHTIDPYRSDPVAAAALDARARAICRQGPEGPRALPEEPFVSDGCSLWTDDGWGEPCCVDHDIRYWCGGEAPERSAADAALRACVDAFASGFLADTMWLGVRVGGHPIFPTHYRWGYGRAYRPWYGEFPESPAEP